MRPEDVAVQTIPTPDDALARLVHLDRALTDVAADLSVASKALAATGAASSFWHYTCDHAASQIGRRGMLRPESYGVVWLTDLAAPDADALGLTSNFISCDRTENRYRVVDTDRIVPWLASPARYRLPPALRQELEHERAAEHWYISTDPVAVVRA